MSLDKTYFEQMEAKIPHGRVRTRFAPSPTGYLLQFQQRLRYQRDKRRVVPF